VTQLAETRTTGSFGVLLEVVAAGNVLVLSGAGLSTESGIPDYRGPTGLARRATPMTFQTFTASAAARRRYWARSHLGWRHIAQAAPNRGHHAVAELGRRGRLAGIITQNVDGLHQAAGRSHRAAGGLHQAAGGAEVTELHGSLHRVMCLSCGQRTARTDLHRRLEAANPGWGATSAASINPDGDAVLADDATQTFRVVDCLACGGVLKPDVVFFGENVPRPRVEACYALVERASSLVVLGSSLTVMSGLRYVRHAAELGRPVVIVNQGTTRGDPFAAATLDAPLGQALAALVAALGPAVAALGPGEPA
jgi:NAD-dependent SIR2 family protein deacetylase